MQLETKLVRHSLCGKEGPLAAPGGAGLGMSETTAAGETAPQRRTRRSGDPPATGELQEVAGLHHDPPHQSLGEGGGNPATGVLGGQAQPPWAVEDNPGRQLLVCIPPEYHRWKEATQGHDRHC